MDEYVADYMHENYIEDRLCTYTSNMYTISLK